MFHQFMMGELDTHIVLYYTTNMAHAVGQNVTGQEVNSSQKASSSACPFKSFAHY